VLNALTGNCDDEGSLFSMSSLNISYVPIDSLLYIIYFHIRLLTKVTDGSDTKGVENYLKTFMLPTATKEEIDLLLQYYPDDPQAGCPFDTGIRNILSTPSFFISISFFLLSASNLKLVRRTVQANRGYPGRYRLPRSTSLFIEISIQQAEQLGFQ